MKSWFVSMMLLAALSLLLGCGDDRPPGTAGNDSTLVGGPCMNNSECDQGLCEMGPTFPGGMCTSSCGETNQCPSGSSCGELESGWVCLVDCMADTDCRTQWFCQPVIEAGTNMGSTKSLCLGSAPAP